MFFFFNDTATTEIYTLSLHDAPPISSPTLAPRLHAHDAVRGAGCGRRAEARVHHVQPAAERSEEHTSELQSRQYLVCRLLLEKKNNFVIIPLPSTFFASPLFLYLIHI